MTTQLLTIQNHKFILHPSGSLYWVEEKILFIADVHFGKITHFRKHGSAVPEIAKFENFRRLNAVISFFQPKTLYILGDLFHSHLNNEWPLFAEWYRDQKCTMILIRGNHDVISPLNYLIMGMRVIDKLVYRGFLFTHYPTDVDTYFNIAGHIHPGVMLKGKGRQRLTVPCFHISKKQLVLPAFGTFTGKYIIRPLKNDIIYAIADNEVIPID